MGGDKEGEMAVVPKVIERLSCLLQQISESNDLDRPCLEAEKMSVFHGLSRPSISIQSYLNRIYRYANCSPACYVVAYVYLDRFANRLPITSLNVHRLLITSVMLSAKFLDDMYYNNAYYAKVGGISTLEMNFLEVDFLFGLGFNLNVTPSTFHSYSSFLHTAQFINPTAHFIAVIQDDTQEEEEEEEEALSSSSSKLLQHMCFGSSSSGSGSGGGHQLAAA